MRGANDMKIKRVLSSALLVLMLTACGKEGSSVEVEIDNSRAESIAQNLQLAMADRTSIAAVETGSVGETLTETEPVTIPVNNAEKELDVDDLPGTWLTGCLSDCNGSRG